MKTKNQYEITEKEKTAALAWFTRLALECMQYPVGFKHERPKKGDVEAWAIFATRMRQVAHATNQKLVEYDLLIKDDKGDWRYSPTAFFLFVQSNIRVMRRVPDLANIVDAYDYTMEYVKRHNAIEDSQQLTAEEKLMLGRRAWDKYQNQVSLL